MRTEFPSIEEGPTGVIPLLYVKAGALMTGLIGGVGIAEAVVRGEANFLRMLPEALCVLGTGVALELTNRESEHNSNGRLKRAAAYTGAGLVALGFAQHGHHEFTADYKDEPGVYFELEDKHKAVGLDIDDALMFGGAAASTIAWASTKRNRII